MDTSLKLVNSSVSMFQGLGCVESNDMHARFWKLTDEGGCNKGDFMIDKKYILSIVSRDRKGKCLATGGYKHLIVVTVEPKPNVGVVEISDNQDGSYGVVLKFLKAGNCSVVVTINGKILPPCPLEYFVISSPTKTLRQPRETRHRCPRR